MKKILFLLFGALFMLDLHAQDPQFSQFYANPLYLNPAFAGSAGGPRFSLNYRNQWPSISGTFVTYSASYDQHFDGIGGGLGMNVWYDRAGDGILSTVNFSAIYSYQLDVTDEFSIKAGLAASVMQRSIDFDQLKFPDQIDARLGFSLPTNEPLAGVDNTDPIPDFSAGFIAYTDKYYGGFALHHITEPNQSFQNTEGNVLPRKMTVHAGMMIPLEGGRNPESFISPNIAYIRQQLFSQIIFGGYFIKKHFTVGAMFRQTDPNADAVMALVGLKKDAFRIGYSYDITVSDLKSAGRGSHEVSLIIELPPSRRTPTRKWRKISCPNI